MDFFKKSNLLVIVSVVVSALFLLWWIDGDHLPSTLKERVIGTDNRPPQVQRSDSVVIGEFFDTLNKFDGGDSGEWPRFRGSFYDNINRDSTPLIDSWDSAGPPVVWKTSLGEGYSGPVVSKGRVYILDYSEKKKADMLRCFSLSSGLELWRRWYYVDIKRNHGYSRTVPAVTDKYLITIGPRSHVMCVDPVSGKLLWTLNMEKDYGIKGREKGRITPDFYTGQCPLIDHDVAIFAPGAKTLMTGIDCSSGKVLWSTANPDSLRMSHGSVMPMTFYNKRMYVYNAIGGVVGISAEGDDLGKILWKTLEWSPPTTAASPLQLDDNEIAVFGSYGAGGARIKISFDGSTFSAKVVEKHKAPDGLSSDQQTPVRVGGYIWTLMPENSGALKKQLVCYSEKDLTKPVWTSGKDMRFGRGLGPYILSGDKLFLLDDDANLFLFKLDGPKALMISKARITNGIEAWGPLAIAGKYLIMRDSRTLVCLNISKRNL